MNILIIMADQQRYDCTGYSRKYPVKTPHLDRLAAEGISFSNAYSHIPICGPARQSFLNGRRAESFGGLWNYNIALKIPSLSPQEYSWPRELASLGYSTCYIGKWGVHPEYLPRNYGYENNIGLEEYQRFKEKEYSHVRYTNGYFGENDPIPVEHSRTHWMAGKVIEYIEKQDSEKPWYIRVNFSEPHLPCRPSEPFSSMYDPLTIPRWDNFEDLFVNKPYIQKQQLLNWGIQEYQWEDWAPIVARYYGIISQLDDAIGRILLCLKKQGIAEDTLVIYTADHGDMCGGHRMMDKHYVLYDDVVKVPLIIKWPGNIPQGHLCRHFIYNMLDLPPTLLDLLDIPIPDFFHGRSIKPIILGGAVNDWRHSVIASSNGQQFGLYTQRMIRTEGYKYIWNTTDVDEFYDLQKDPGELTNAIYHPEYKEIIDEFRKELYHQLLQDGDGLVGNHWMKDQLLKGNKL